MTILTIADALVTMLNAGSYSQTFTAARKVLPRYGIEDLTALKVTVVPASCESSMATRETSDNEYAIEIGIQKKLSSDTDTDIAPMLILVNEIISRIKTPANRILNTTNPSVWLKTENNPVYDREHLASQLVFTSLLTVTYKVME